MAKVAVSVTAGAAASMGGMVRSGTVLCCASCIGFLSCVISSLMPSPFKMFHAGRFHGVNKRTHPKPANPISFRKDRLLSTIWSAAEVSVVFLRRIAQSLWILSDKNLLCETGQRKHSPLHHPQPPLVPTTEWNSQKPPLVFSTFSKPSSQDAKHKTPLFHLLREPREKACKGSY